jgi:hypothetical protein
MKKIFNNNRLIAVFSMATAPAALANDKNPVVPVQLTYVGNVQNQPLFQLSFTGNSLQNDFTIIISDEYGNSLYRENIKAENFTKRFLVNTEELGDETLHFTIFCKNTKTSVQYAVNRNTRQVQDILVSEVSK